MFYSHRVWDITHCVKFHIDCYLHHCVLLAPYCCTFWHLMFIVQHFIHICSICLLLPLLLFDRLVDSCWLNVETVQNENRNIITATLHDNLLTDSVTLQANNTDLICPCCTFSFLTITTLSTACFFCYFCLALSVQSFTIVFFSKWPVVTQADLTDVNNRGWYFFQAFRFSQWMPFDIRYRMF